MSELKIVGNGFCNPPPDRDASGRLAQEFADSLFLYAYCDVCGRDEKDHTFMIGPTGHWFAKCDLNPREDMLARFKKVCEGETKEQLITRLMNLYRMLPSDMLDELYEDLESSDRENL